MNRRRIVLLVVVGAALAVPAAASAHASIVRTVPAENAVFARSSPRQVALAYDGAVGPRFATIEVGDAQGHELATAAVRRSSSNPNTAG